MVALLRDLFLPGKRERFQNFFMDFVYVAFLFLCSFCFVFWLVASISIFGQVELISVVRVLVARRCCAS